MARTNVDVSRDAIKEWLRGRAAFYLVLPAAEVRGDAKLVGYGLDSADALSICTEIEDRFDLAVEPTMMWEHPTVAALADHLSGLLESR
jgi:acyl carrier protein